MGIDDAEWFEPADLAAWGDWLATHHDRGTGVWLVTWKQATGRQQFGYEDGVVEALRFGWVDSTRRRVDDERSRLWYAPRKPGSGWAATNKARIAALEAEGRLAPAGRAVVEAARADGSWSLFDDAERLVVPDDLEAALDAHPGSREQWDAFPPSARRALLQWIALARRPATRARRVTETASEAAHGRRANEWVPKEKR